MSNPLIILLINTLGVIITSYIIPGVTVSNVFIAFVVALVFGIVNTFVRPLVLLLTLPLTLVTFGLFIFVINALMVALTAAIVPGFKVNNFLSALLFSIVLSVINWVLYIIYPS